MHAHARDLVLFLFLLPCVSASRVTGRVHRHKGGDKEIFNPGIGALQLAARRPGHARPAIHVLQPGRMGPIMGPIAAASFRGLAKGTRMMASSSTPAPVMTPVSGLARNNSFETAPNSQFFGSSSQDDVASTTDGTTKESNDVSEHDVSDAQAQAGNLTVVASEALRRKRFIAALSFAVGAAAVFDNIGAARAQLTPGSMLAKASKKALGFGLAGATAGIVQVISLMWLHTAVTYQYRYGGDLKGALKTLYHQGGLRRLYQGLPFALVQVPLAKFGDTAANVGVLALLDAIPRAAGLPLAVKSVVASFTSGLWKIFCMPLDTSRTALQVEGKAGFETLKQRVLKQGPGPLYQGSFANLAGHMADDYPWFMTYNLLDGKLPLVPRDRVLVSLIRSAFLGLSASCAAGIVSNSFKVIQTTQQTALLKADDHPLSLGDKTVDAEGSETRAEAGENLRDKKSISVGEALTLVIQEDGIKGLLGRGLKSKLLLDAIQGTLFSVLWRYFQVTGGMR